MDPKENDTTKREGPSSGPDCAESAGSDPSYDAKLAAWKARMGVPENAAGKPEPDAEDLMVAEDSKRTGKDYCILCADEFPISEMRLITQTVDPYVQDDERPYREDGFIPVKYRVRACEPCFDARYGSGDDCDAE